MPVAQTSVGASNKASEFLQIYDERPSHDALLARCKRDKADPQQLHEIIIDCRFGAGTKHAVQAYGRPVIEHKPVRLTDGSIGQETTRAWMVYRLKLRHMRACPP